MTRVTVRTRNPSVQTRAASPGVGLVDVDFSSELNFYQINGKEQAMYKEATGQSLTFTLGTNNENGIGIILRLNKPAAVTFPGNFEAHANSATLDATKLNVYTLVYFSNWNGSGTTRVVYTNSLYTAI